ncbi:hypothetical protein vseg_020864 [Gypsophila vaccaria]
MEEAPYSVLGKRARESFVDDDESWEEKAFAEDAAGIQGGECVWPPRSYFCSFCKREFRSAQALGGHMNVHRRDRAKLKQFSTPFDNNNNQNISSYKEFCFNLRNPNSYQNIVSDPTAFSSKLYTQKKIGFRPTVLQEDHIQVCFKRSKLTDEDEVEHPTSEVNGLKSCSIQELDLELRLGNPPKTCKKCLNNLFA